MALRMFQRAQYTQKAPQIIKIISFEGSRGTFGGDIREIYIYINMYIHIHISTKRYMSTDTRGPCRVNMVAHCLQTLWIGFGANQKLIIYSRSHHSRVRISVSASYTSNQKLAIAIPMASFLD